jgi:hypothetical protein
MWIIALIVITIDASASGLGFVIGDPSCPFFTYAAAWSWAQSINTSNWRESKAIVIALAVLRNARPTLLRPGVAILVRSDNQSAVSLVNKESSSSDSLHAVGGIGVPCEANWMFHCCMPYSWRL